MKPFNDYAQEQELRHHVYPSKRTVGSWLPPLSSADFRHIPGHAHRDSRAAMPQTAVLQRVSRSRTAPIKEAVPFCIFQRHMHRRAFHSVRTVQSEFPGPLTTKKHAEHPSICSTYKNALVPEVWLRYVR